MPDNLRLWLNGRAIQAPVGSVVAAALARAGVSTFRRSVEGEPRAPLCGMGICYECRVTIDDVPNCLSCLVECAEGMRVETT
jgi:hypothetical protein